jgi:hypothetical protein
MSRPLAGRHRAAGALVTSLLVAVALGGCGGSSTAGGPPAWRAAHPDPPGYSFRPASGVCLITVRYPDEAPGLIVVQGGDTLVQVGRGAAHQPPETSVARSGDWTVFRTASDHLALLTPTALFDYRSGIRC